MDKNEKNELIKKLIPFSLTLIVVLVDQITKAMVVNTIPPYTIYWSWCDELVRIVHVRNLGVAFSIGYSWPLALRKVAFSVIPLLVIVYVVKVYFKSNELTNLQRWCVCGIIGGGLGNLIDRIFRSSGVVDFIDVKFFGILGMDRWPTFNVGDAAVVVTGIILIVSFFVMVIKVQKKDKKSEEVLQGEKNDRKRL